MEDKKKKLDFMTTEFDFNNMLSSLDKTHDDEAVKKVLSIQKKKFLITINKTNFESFSKEDEEFVKMVTEDLLGGSLNIHFANSSHQWEGDSKEIADVEVKLRKHAVFKLSEYLDCAKTVFLAYSSKYEEVYSAIEYVLTHSRQFGDPSKNIFENAGERSSNEEIDAATPTLPPMSKRPSRLKINTMNRVDQLIEDLRKRYDETNYRILNANATYFALLMLRQITKNEPGFSASLKTFQTHDNYVKLCPWPLFNQLPTPNTSKLMSHLLIDSARLAIHAYLNTEDDKTKRILRTTCVQYMEWKGLELPNLFFKMVDLYGIEAGILWDSLSFKGTEIALINLGQDYYTQYNLLMENLMDQRWFPYCRVLNEDLLRNLSADNKNKKLCIILAYLVDMKIGFARSTNRRSRWVVTSPQKELKSCAAKAKQLYEMLNKIDHNKRADEEDTTE